ncbi:hypothetical protein QQY79_15155 [Flavobacterium tructae]|uniref:hypothetical protein n=1 Tax=Flavobacterium tructae TaxID=1114873 RepID=UPI0025520584|nr:hypothetical protein [Flavobacterium tructae]MDL2143864.1 hypothetical protein [Flavobacterium tructae]
MKKLTLIIFSTFFIFQSSYSQQRVRVQAIQVDSSFDNISLVKLEEAIKILDSIYNSEAFAQAVLHTDFNVGNFGLTNYQILELIRSGTDNYKDKPKDYSIDIRVKIFDKYLGHDNFGITDMNTRITETHRCYILHNDLKCYISHLGHEYMHEIGFYDDKTWIFGTKTKSVPYKIGNIIDRLIDNIKPCLAKDEICEKQ